MQKAIKLYSDKILPRTKIGQVIFPDEPGYNNGNLHIIASSNSDGRAEYVEAKKTYKLSEDSKKDENSNKNKSSDKKNETSEKSK